MTLPVKVIEYPRTPANLQPYVDVLGVKGAMTFILQFGGGELYLTSNPKRRARLVEMIGQDRAADLSDRIPRSKMRVPTAKPWLSACLKAEGLSVAEIARTLHVTDTSVRRWLQLDPSQGDGNSSGPDPRQLSLF